jgi:hypothetical protein
LRAWLRVLVYAPQHGRQSVTVAVLAVAGLMVVGLLAVWIPLSPALEGAYGLTAADSATSGVFFAAAFAIGELGGVPPVVEKRRTWARTRMLCGGSDGRVDHLLVRLLVRR